MGKKVFVIGSGAVGTSLGRALARAGREIIGIYDIDARVAGEAARQIGVQGFGGALPDMIKQADTVVVTVPDHVIPQVAEWALAEELYSEQQIWIHCSGHLTADVFSPIVDHVRGTATMHPAFVFPPHTCTEIPTGVFFAVGGDEAGVAKATEHVALLKGQVLRVAPEKRALYHSAMVMGSNYIVSLLATARDTLAAAGLPPEQSEELLFSLGQSALSRSKNLGIGHSLSGPVRRGDVTVVKDHLNALAPLPDASRVYKEMGKATVRLAATQEGYCQDTAETLMELLDD